jgi:hypothetical protein
MALTYCRLFRGGALDSQVTDSQFVNGLLGNGQNALFNNHKYQLMHWRSHRWATAYVEWGN